MSCLTWQILGSCFYATKSERAELAAAYCGRLPASRPWSVMEEAELRNCWKHSCAVRTCPDPVAVLAVVVLLLAGVVVVGVDTVASLVDVRVGYESEAVFGHYSVPAVAAAAAAADWTLQ
jgi:hypothetical protein